MRARSGSFGFPRTLGRLCCGGLGAGTGVGAGADAEDAEDAEDTVQRMKASHTDVGLVWVADRRSTVRPRTTKRTSGNDVTVADST